MGQNSSLPHSTASLPVGRRYNALFASSLPLSFAFSAGKISTYVREAHRQFTGSLLRRHAIYEVIPNQVNNLAVHSYVQ